VITRRILLRIAGGAFAVEWRRSARSAVLEGQSWRHGLSLFGNLKYRSGFAYFDYVNPHAPKGGVVRQAVLGTYNNFNVVVAGWKGQLAAGIGLIYDTLLTPSLDEASAEYGLLAEAVLHPADFSSVTFRLHPEAKWHDGRSVTPDDVVFSFNAFKENNPRLSTYHRHIVMVAPTGEREITFTFDSGGNRELPQIVGQLTILPKHWWETADQSGNRRSVAATSLEPPIGSGPYRIAEFKPGRMIAYQRVDNYWGKDLNVRVGRDNFDEIRFEYFRDSNIAFEAFKAGELDWHEEKSAKNWATAYGFPAVDDKRVVRAEFPIRNIGLMQAFVFNIRRSKFKDARLRRAFNFAFDFETLNNQIFYGQYKRIASYFEGTELASSGLPSGEELKILETVREEVPPEVFSTAYTNPIGGNENAVRSNLREATRLLQAAGFAVRDFKLVDSRTGEPLTVEFLLADPAFERFVLFYKEWLQRLGIEVTVRSVDHVQYENRLREWDFDIVVAAWPQTLSPGNEQRDYWGSHAANTPGSHNIIGITSEAVDSLIDHIVFAKDRAGLTAATRALDRVLLWSHYVVPQWSYSKARTARWDRFGRPDPMPAYGSSGFPTLWWWRP
jgi:microcin C transport system substrate-binding protein